MRMSLFGYATISLVLAAAIMPHDCLAQGAPPAQHCVPGQVWRDAFDGDGICVPPQRRDEVHRENALAARRVQAGGGAYGPDTCVQGYVWRATRPSDHVCVTPGSRDLVARENSGTAPVAPAAAQVAHVAHVAPVVRCDDLCMRELQAKQREIIEWRRRLAERQRALAVAKVEDRKRDRKAMEQLRAADEKFARENPGLGQSSSPSMGDSVSPIKRRIGEIEVALRAAELEAARLQARADGSAPAPAQAIAPNK